MERNITSEIYKGANFFNSNFNLDCNGIMAIGDNITIHNGEFSVSLITNSYKYDKEIQFRVLSAKEGNLVQQKKRIKESSWNRTEINIPYNQIDYLIETLLTFKKIVEK